VVRALPLIVAAVIAVAAPGQRAEAAPSFVPAQSARAFGDSVGVNTHIGWEDTPGYANFDAVRSRMLELGVRHIRDGVCATCVEWISRLQRLGAVGIRANIISTDFAGDSPRLQENLQAIKSKLRGMVESVEAPNEPDQTGDPAWISKTRRLQQELWNRVKGDPALRHIDVLGPALVYRDNWALLGDLSAYVDRGNLHPYPGGGTPLHNLAGLIPPARIVSGSDPIVATEAGYHSDLATTSGHYGTSEQAIGVYTPRLALEGFRQGLARTYVYQLIDPWTNVSGFEASFGLLRPDLSRKPAFNSLRNLLRAVDAGSGPVQAPGGLRLGFDGAPGDLRRLLLRSDDGSYALVLWREVSVWDRVARRDLAPAADTVDVELGDRIALARRFDPVASPDEQQRWVNPSRLSVALAGAPVVLELAPPGSEAARQTVKGLKSGARRSSCVAQLGRPARSRKARARAAKCCRTTAKAKRKRAGRKRAGRKSAGRKSAKWALAGNCRKAPKRKR
jgi:hypothetical protein